MEVVRPSFDVVASTGKRRATSPYFKKLGFIISDPTIMRVAYVTFFVTQ